LCACLIFPRVFIVYDSCKCSLSLPGSYPAYVYNVTRIYLLLLHLLTKNRDNVDECSLFLHTYRLQNLATSAILESSVGDSYWRQQ